MRVPVSLVVVVVLAVLGGVGCSGGDERSGPGEVESVDAAGSEDGGKGATTSQDTGAGVVTTDLVCLQGC